MNEILTCQMLAGLAMRTELTPAEHEILNQFLRGGNQIAD